MILRVMHVDVSHTQNWHRITPLESKDSRTSNNHCNLSPKAPSMIQDASTAQGLHGHG